MTTTTGGCAMTDEPTPERTLADLRKELKISQQKLADAMGVNVSTVKRIEMRYPNVMATTIQGYLKGLGARVVYTGLPSGDVAADTVIANPNTAATLAYTRAEPSRIGGASPKKLPLQGDQPQPGGDDPGREVDQPDTDSDQSDGGHCQKA